MKTSPYIDFALGFLLGALLVFVVLQADPLLWSAPTPTAYPATSSPTTTTEPTPQPTPTPQPRMKPGEPPTPVPLFIERHSCIAGRG